ncbi:MAG TPA: hypothetical protein VGL93_33120 [Streptosporangiaceae bacterium]|jgi:phenylpyruvate tautomerase PptA (4-oxalocrotonate tautomerase family)
MPHFTVVLGEEHLGGGAEKALISGLAEAVGAVFGERLRQVAVVEVFGVPPGRRGVGGVPATENAPVVTLNLREGAFHLPTVPDAEVRLITEISDAVGSAYDEGVRGRTTVQLFGIPPGRSGEGGEVA